MHCQHEFAFGSVFKHLKYIPKATLFAKFGEGVRDACKLPKEVISGCTVLLDLFVVVHNIIFVINILLIWSMINFIG